MPNLYDRMLFVPGLLKDGEIGAAGRAILSPDTLAPEQRVTPGDKQRKKGNSLAATVLDAIANPLLLTGMLLSIRYPIANAKHLLKVKEKMVGWDKRLGPGMKSISSLPLQFANTKGMDGLTIPDHFHELGLHNTQFKSKHGKRINVAIEKYLKATKQSFIPAEEQSRVFHWLNGSHATTNFGAGLGEIDRPFINSSFSKWMNAPKQKHLKVFSKDLRKCYDGMYTDIYGADAQGIIIETLRYKGYKGWGAEKTLLDLRATAGKMGVKLSPQRKGFSLYETTVDDVYNHLMKNDPKFEGFAKTLNYQTLAQKDRTNIALEGMGITLRPSKQALYQPHIRKFSSYERERFTESLFHKTGGSKALAGEIATEAAASYTAPSAKRRFGGMVADPMETRKYMEPFIDEEMYHKLYHEKVPGRIKGQLNAALEIPKITGEDAASRILETRSEKIKTFFGKKLQLNPAKTEQIQHNAMEFLVKGDEKGLQAYIRQQVGDFQQVYGNRGFYSTQLMPVLDNYLNTTGNMYGWTVKGKGMDIKLASKKLDAVGKSMMKDVYIPQAMGRMSQEQAVQSLEWSASRNQMLQKLDSHEGWVKYLPKSMNKWMKEQLITSHGPISWGQMSGKVAGHFYYSALGFNTASAIRNTLQTLLTTGPLIGTSHTLAGMKEASNRIGKYTKLRLGSKGIKALGHEDAFNRAFPQFINVGLDPSPFAQGIIQGSLDTAWNQALLKNSSMTKAKDLYGKMQHSMMSMFTASERWNRLVSFYGGRHKYIADVGKTAALRRMSGFAATHADNFGRQVVEFTQFPAGPGQSPWITRNLSPLFKMFTHFPLRYAEFLAGSTMMGPGKGRNWGTIGRGMVGASAAYSIGKNVMGTDLSGALMTGALPLPQNQGGPFAPFPIVPPVVGIAGAAVQDVMSGELDQLKRVAPLAIPGGIALNRVRRNFSPEFADYENRTPDGRIPLFSPSKSLIGYQTPMQLVGRTLGFQSIDQEQEKELMGYLIKQRDVIREYRRNYAEALSGNDTTKAEEIQAKWAAQFPQFKRIQIRPQEMKAIAVRKRVTRLERILDTLPKDQRAQYGQAVVMALSDELTGLMGVDPSYLQAHNMTATKRPRLFGGGQGGQGGQAGQYGAATQPTQPMQPMRPQSPMGPQSGVGGSVGSSVGLRSVGSSLLHN